MSAKFKYYAKVPQGNGYRYFYTKAEYDAYRNGTRPATPEENKKLNEEISRYEDKKRDADRYINEINSVKMPSLVRKVGNNLVFNVNEKSVKTAVDEGKKWANAMLKYNLNEFGDGTGDEKFTTVVVKAKRFIESISKKIKR